MSIFVELHALRSFPPGNLNRDDLGSPKTALFGSSRRLRVSSQCLKRTWRISEQFRGAFAEEELGVRTDRLPEEVLKAVGDTLDKQSSQGLIALLTSLGKKKAESDDGDDDEGEAGDPDSADAEKKDAEKKDAEKKDSESDAPEARTPHLLFLSLQEIKVVGDFAKLNKEHLSNVFSKKKVDAKRMKELRAKLHTYLRENTKRNAVDVGLFGRFVTSDEFDTIDAALQVAHALGTQKVEIEYDYFTAVDDLSKEAGAGHLGETEFASSVLYLYACCDLAQLERNLGARSEAGRQTDGQAQELARKSLPALVRAMALATPTGKRTGTAPHTPAEFLEVVVRKGSPLSFANAFLKPVDGREEGGDVMAGSISRYAQHRDTVEQAYGREKDVQARFVLCLRPVTGAAAAGTEVKTLAELGEKLAAVLKRLPPQAAQ